MHEENGLEIIWSFCTYLKYTKHLRQKKFSRPPSVVLKGEGERQRARRVVVVVSYQAESATTADR